MPEAVLHCAGADAISSRGDAAMIVDAPWHDVDRAAVAPLGSGIVA
jgi:hypothetical protein